MRATLLLCLFAILSCKLDNVLEKASCLVKNEKGAKAIVEIFETLKNKQYSLIPKLLLNDFKELKALTDKCLKTDYNLDEILLNASVDLQVCLKACLGAKLCIEACLKKYS